MSRYVDGRTMQEIQVTPQQDKAYQALKIAAEKMARNNYIEQTAKWLMTHKNLKKFRFIVTLEHEELVQAMPKILNGDITPEEAMSLLWQPETFRQRTGS